MDNVGERTIDFELKQLQHAFKHAADFGVNGHYNCRTLRACKLALVRHVRSDRTEVRAGWFRHKPVTHFVDTDTRLNVIRDAQGGFLSGWRLSSRQMAHEIGRASCRE